MSINRAIAEAFRSIRLSAPSFLVSVLAIVALFSCSSLPTDTVEQEIVTQRRQAVDYARQGDAALGARNWQQAENFYNLSLDGHRAVDNLEGAAQADFSLGYLYLLTGRPDDAETMYQDGSELAELTGNANLIATGFLNRSKVFQYRNKPTETVALLQKAIEAITFANGTTDPLNDALKASILHSRGLALRDMAKIAEARADFEAALKLNTELKKLRERAANLYMLASLDNGESKDNEAIKKLLLALELDKQAEASENIAKDLWALAVLYRKVPGADGKPRLTEAWDAMRRSLNVSLAIVDPVGTERCLTALIGLAKELGKNDEAKKYAALYDRLQANKAKK